MNMSVTKTKEAPLYKETWEHWWERNLRYIFVLPSVVMILAIGLFPLLYSLGISFLNWDLQRPGRQFIFFKNYLNALSDDRLWSAMGHTLTILFIAVLLELIIGLGLAQTLIGR